MKSGLLGNLREFQFDRRSAAKDGNRHLQALVVFVDLFDRTIEVFERTVVDFDLFADIEADHQLRRRLTFFDAAKDRFDFGIVWSCS